MKKILYILFLFPVLVFAAPSKNLPILWDGANFISTSTRPFIVGNITATSTNASSTFLGGVGIGTTSPYSALSVVGNIAQKGKLAHFGSTYSTVPCDSFGAECLEFVGNNSNNAGVTIGVENENSGSSAYTGYGLFNDRIDTNTSNFAGIYLNSSAYNDATFGFANSFPDLLSFQNTMGDIAIMASSTAINTNGNIKFYNQGVAASNLSGIITRGGLWGIGTSTPAALLTVQSPVVSTFPIFQVQSNHFLPSGQTAMSAWGRAAHSKLSQSWLRMPEAARITSAVLQSRISSFRICS